MLNIQENISLKNYNTFRIDVKARFFVEVKSIQDVKELLESGICDQLPQGHSFHRVFVLGSGANVLFTKDYEGTVIKVSLKDKEIINEDSEFVYVKAGAGENRHQFVMWCVEGNLGGVENLAFIPGTVGASAVGNIGAYGVEVKDLIESVEYVDMNSKEIKTIKNADCKFAYRESTFKQELRGKVLISAVVFKLHKVANGSYKLNLDYKDIKQVIVDKGLNVDELTIHDIQNIIVAIRQKKLDDPSQRGTAGSFFKNPVISEKEYLGLKEKYPNLIGNPVDGGIKLSAGQVIELCGLKGYVQGNVAVSDKHALVLINLGNGTGEEMLQLANHIISKVQKNFGLTLEPEVIVV